MQLSAMIQCCKQYLAVLIRESKEYQRTQVRKLVGARFHFWKPQGIADVLLSENKKHETWFYEVDF